MNIIDEIKEREKRYKKGNMEVTSKNDVIKKWGKDSLLYKTRVSFDYFKEFMKKKFPDLELVRIVSVTSDYTPCYQDTIWNNKYTVEYAMMSKQNIEMLIEEEKDLVFKDNKSYIIVAHYSYYKKKKLKRDEILTICPIIILYNNSYSNEGRLTTGYYLDEVTQATFPERIALYPDGTYDNDKKDKTRFLLYANSPVISQKRLDSICMSMLMKLNKEADSKISKEIFIYESIRKKLLNGEKLNNDEWEIIQRFLNSEENRIRSKHTLLKRSLVKKKDKK